MLLQFFSFLALLANAAVVIEAAKPCRANHPTTETVEMTTTPTETTSGPKAPCMAVWENMKPEEPDFADYAIETGDATTAEQCGKTCEADVKCAYSLFKTGKCLTFERFIAADFSKNGDMSLIFKLYLNGTIDCGQATIDALANKKEKMYYPDGGTYWLFNNIMNTIGYASNNPAMGYKRRKRSILGWFFGF